MQALNVQFSDPTDSEIASYFASPQPANWFTNLGTVETNDTRWQTYYAQQPIAIRQFLPTPNA